MKRATLFCLAVFLAGQTRINTNQIQGFPPVTKVERSQCVGSGTTADGGRWDCTGIQMYKLTLADGTVLGPYIAIKATPEMAADTKWQTLPLTAPDPQ